MLRCLQIIFFKMYLFLKKIIPNFPPFSCEENEKKQFTKINDSLNNFRNTLSIVSFNKNHSSLFLFWLKKKSSIKLSLVFFFFLTQIVISQNPFAAGDKIEMFFKDSSKLTTGIEYDADTTKDVNDINNDNDAIAFMGVGDYVVHRNGTTLNGASINRVFNITAVSNFTRTLNVSPELLNLYLLLVPL